MIYFKFGHKHLLILEPGNMRKLREGSLATTPDKEVGVAYTPDAQWLSERLKEALGGGAELETEKLEELLKEGMEREPREAGPYHEAIVLGGKPVE